MQIDFIRPDEVNAYLQKGAQFIDLRDREDYDKKHIKNALSIPYDSMEESYKSLSKDKIYIFYCERGATSILAVRKLSKMGYKVKSLSGGFVALSRMKND